MTVSEHLDMTVSKNKNTYTDRLTNISQYWGKSSNLRTLSPYSIHEISNNSDKTKKSCLMILQMLAPIHQNT